MTAATATKRKRSSAKNDEHGAALAIAVCNCVRTCGFNKGGRVRPDGGENYCGLLSSGDTRRRRDWQRSVQAERHPAK